MKNGKRKNIEHLKTTQKKTQKKQTGLHIAWIKPLCSATFCCSAVPVIILVTNQIASLVKDRWQPIWGGWVVID